MQPYKLQMEMQKQFIHEHPKDATNWKMPEVESFVSDPRVHTIARKKDYKRSSQMNSKNN